MLCKPQTINKFAWFGYCCCFFCTAKLQHKRFRDKKKRFYLCVCTPHYFLFWFFGQSFRWLCSRAEKRCHKSSFYPVALIKCKTHLPEAIDVRKIPPWWCAHVSVCTVLAVEKQVSIAATDHVCRARGARLRRPRSRRVFASARSALVRETSLFVLVASFPVARGWRTTDPF